jgi:hypothetical protein
MKESPMTRFLVWLGLSLAAAGAVGCKSQCESLCSDAQAGNCTAITGDCGIFCSSIQTVASEGNCETQYNNYEACLDQGPVCSQDCTGQQAALSTCAGAYCLGHTGDTNCQTITAALK